MNAAQKKTNDLVALVAALPDRAAKVAGRANAAKGVISQAQADRLVGAGLGVIGEDGRLHLAEVKDGASTPAAETPEDRADQAVAATPPAKVNGRKAAAEKSPYSTAPVTNFIKRHGKSRRTGSETQILDLLHRNGADVDVKAHTNLVAKKAPGRYRVECITHKKHKDVPDMTEAKPLQARTDTFCPKCKAAVEGKEQTPAA